MVPRRGDAEVIAVLYYVEMTLEVMVYGIVPTALVGAYLYAPSYT